MKTFVDAMIERDRKQSQCEHSNTREVKKQYRDEVMVFERCAECGHEFPKRHD